MPVSRLRGLRSRLARNTQGLQVSNVEDARKPETARGAARQNDGLEGVEQHGKQANNAGNQSKIRIDPSFPDKGRRLRARCLLLILAETGTQRLPMSELGKALLGLGLLIAVIGALLLLAALTSACPGMVARRISYKGKHVSIFFPLGTSILISILLSASSTSFLAFAASQAAECWGNPSSLRYYGLGGIAIARHDRD